jgi:hypothetical protein
MRFRREGFTVQDRLSHCLSVKKPHNNSQGMPTLRAKKVRRYARTLKVQYPLSGQPETSKSNRGRESCGCKKKESRKDTVKEVRASRSLLIGGKKNLGDRAPCRGYL